MKIVRIDELAPGGAEIELHPQLTVLRGVSPEMRRRLIELFNSLADETEPGCGGLIEVSGVHLGLDRATLDGLRLDPLVDPILVWPTAADRTPGEPTVAAPSVAPRDGRSVGADTAAPRWNPPVPVSGAQVIPDPRDLVVQYLARDRDQLRGVSAQRTELGRRMDDVRAGLDSFANAALEVCVGQIDALESRRSLLRSQWERDRAVRVERRHELAASLARANDVLDALVSLDLSAVRSARDTLSALLDAPIEPDPAANELATRIDDALRAVRQLSGRASSAELRRHEAEQRLAEAIADASTAEQTMRARVVDPADVNRLDQVRDEIFAFDDRHSRLGANRNKRKVRELRDEEAVLLERLGFDTYSSYVMGIPSVRAELERSSRLDAATTRIEQIERELQSLAADEPDAVELSAAEGELSMLLSSAAQLLDDAALQQLSIETSIDGGAGDARGLGRGRDERASARADLVHSTVSRLRARRIVSQREIAPEAYAAADQLRDAVQQLGLGRFADPTGASAPMVGTTQIDAGSWQGSPRDLLDGTDRWLASLSDSSVGVDGARQLVSELHRQIAELDRDELHQGDVSEWAVVEAELDAALDRMAAAEERVRVHEQAIAELAALRDTELGLRATERELLGAIAAREQELRDWPMPGAVVPPTTRLPPVYRPAGGLTDPVPATADAAASDRSSAVDAADDNRASTSVADLEWLLIERLAQQRAVSFVGSVPLLLDGVPADEDSCAAVFGRAARLDELVQIVVLSDDDRVLDWVAHSAPAAAVIQF